MDLSFDADGKAQVVVHVPVRAGHSGYWALKRFFPTGPTSVTVTKAELENLLGQPVIAITAAGETLSNQLPPPMDLSPDEETHVRAYREAMAQGLLSAFLTHDELESLSQLRALPSSKEEPSPHVPAPSPAPEPRKKSKKGHAP